jgi:hypothetical protein
VLSFLSAVHGDERKLEAFTQGTNSLLCSSSSSSSLCLSCCLWCIVSFMSHPCFSNCRAQ